MTEKNEPKTDNTQQTPSSDLDRIDNLLKADLPGGISLPMDWTSKPIDINEYPPAVSYADAQGNIPAKPFTDMAEAFAAKEKAHHANQPFRDYERVRLNDTILIQFLAEETCDKFNDWLTYEGMKAFNQHLRSGL